MKTLRTLPVLLLLVGAGYLTSRPPCSGLAFVALPLLAWLQRRDGLVAPWYLLAFFLGVGAKIPFAVVDVGSGLPLALSIWTGYGLVAAFVATPPRFVRGDGPMSSWAMLTLSVPVIGFLFVAPPVSAAGWWFPGTGAVGVLLVVWLGAAILKATQTSRLAPLFAPAGIAAVLNVALLLAPLSPLHLVPVSMPVEPPPTNLARSILASVRFAPAVHAAFADGAQTVVLPENVLGYPGPVSVGILDIPKGKTVVAGGVARVPGSAAYQKGTWVLPQRVFFPAIQPIPLIEPSLDAHWSALHKLALIDGNPYSLLVCFEASTTVPLYHLHYGSPIILIGNGWWDRSGIMDIEAGLAQSWARLFRSNILFARGFPVVRKTAFFQ